MTKEGVVDMANKNQMQETIAKSAAQELVGPCIVNLGIGIPTLVSKPIEDDSICIRRTVYLA